jgi:hypothetical protein
MNREKLENSNRFGRELIKRNSQYRFSLYGIKAITKVPTALAKNNQFTYKEIFPYTNK